MQARRLWIAVSIAVGVTLLIGLKSCRSLTPVRVDPVPEAASEAFAAARAALRWEDAEGRRRAAEEAERALSLAPAWVAPARLLDDLLREDLRGLDALAMRRRDLDRDEHRAEAQYLAGRLEGDAGEARFALAVQLDSTLAWGHHGLAWSAARSGDPATAARREREAVARARDPYERAYFRQSLVRFLGAAGKDELALEELERGLEAADLTPLDAIDLELLAVELELGVSLGAEGRRGYLRGLALLRERELTAAEVERLFTRMRAFAGIHDVDALELQLALAAREGALRDRLRAELMLDHRPTPLALGLLERARAAEGLAPAAGPVLRAARFAGGQFARAVDAWLDGLPRGVLDADGLPRDARLARVVRDARAWAALAPGEVEARHEALARLGDALVEAGWFAEARSVAAAMAAGTPELLDHALALEGRAAGGQHVLLGLSRLLESLDHGEDDLATFWTAAESGDAGEKPERAAPEPIEDLDDLLAAFGRVAASSSAVLGAGEDAEALAAELAASPRLSYGPVGALVHPGPLFSDDDEREQRGRRGDAVPGLARLFDRLGRFGLFGSLRGIGPDGTVLRRVLVEDGRGTHLGQPWSGSIAWCEGVDVPSRLNRRGATIAGAALHEGYWVDFEVVRRQSQRWRDLELRFVHAPEGRERLDLALETRGLELLNPPDRTDAHRRERRAVDPLLGAGDRVRLAVFRDRLEAGGDTDALVGLDELVLLTAIHEQGHLCDRARFLPIHANLGRAIGLLARSGFSVRGVQERLEYRAQLVALCDVLDPRLALAEILSASDGDLAGETPHAAAYRSLLTDLLALLDEELVDDPAAWPALDPDRQLVHQLHTLDPEALRGLARRLARREGLFEG